MDKLMILAILVAYKAFNDKSLTVVVNKGEGEYVVNKAIIDNIDGDNISVLSWTYSGVYGETINVNDIDYEDIYDNIDDYEYPYNHINRSDLQV